MASNTGYGKISTSGLTFAYDMGDTDVSYKGKPTINYVTNAGTMANFGNYSCGTPVTFTTEFGTIGYRMHNLGSWNGVVMGGISLPSSGTYTFSAYIRYLGGSSNNNGGTVYTSGFGVGNDTAAYHNKSIVGEWFRLTNTQTCTTAGGTFYLISYGGTYCDDFSSWEVTMPQIEVGSVATPWVDGTRSPTQGLLDITGNSTLDLSNVSFDSNTQMTFDGTNDYIQTNQTGTYSQITYEFIGFFDDPTLSTTSRNESAFGDWTDGRVHFGTRWSVGMHWNVNNVWNQIPTTNLRYGWNHYCLIYDNTTNRKIVYLNGNLSDSTTTNGNLVIGDFKIGVATNLGAYYRGTIPVFKIYNRALTASETLSNYQHYRSRFSLPAVKDGSTSALAAPNAQHLYNLGIRARGTYWIKPTGYGGSEQEIYCDFDANGGWMMVSSNNASVDTIPGGTARNNSNYYLNRSGAIGFPNPNGDFIIGSIIDNLEFSKVKIIGWGFASINGTYTYPSNLGTYVTAEWSLITTGSSRYTEKVARGNVTIGGNGTVAPSANYFVLDAVRNNVGFNANQNQSTIGGAGVQSASGDPWEGCYLGHGITEGSWEGWYNTNSSVNDSQGYTTWVR